MRRSDRVSALRALGFRVRSTNELVQATRNFQGGYAIGPALTVDGHAGAKTDAAIEHSHALRMAGKPDASAHFSFHEFWCKCDGKFSACQRVWVKRELLVTLDHVRDKWYPQGLTVVSGCRCNGHNHAVGGASSSQHLYGGACDIPPRVPRQVMARAELAAGIGFNSSTGLVAHVDRRDKSGHNTTGASPSRPTIWIYHR